MALDSIAVYCGSSDGNDPIYLDLARQTGELIAKANKTLVYGGSNVGCMGTVANAALAFEGDVIGVVPKKLALKNIQHPDLTKLYVVEGMHERKAKMMASADGFISLPGGPGTMEEFFEVFTWAQVGYHEKPVGILNVNNYYQPLLDFMDKMVEEGFMQAEYRDMVVVSDDPADLIEKMENYEQTIVAKWA